MSPTTLRAALHRLIDDLPEEELGVASRFLEFLRSLAPPAQLTSSEEEMNRDDEARHAAYEATGEHIANEDVVAWLKSRGTANELPPPTHLRRRDK